MNIEPVIRYLLVTGLVFYLSLKAWWGVSKVKENVTGIAIEKLRQGNYFKHPLYTFCPEYRDDAEVIPITNITKKTTLAQVTSDQIQPSDFVISVTDGDGRKPLGDSWIKVYRISSSFEQREKRIFSPCFTYDNPNQYMVGKTNASIKFVIKGGHRGIVEDISLSMHDRHGHIDSVYPTITGRRIVTLPSQRRDKIQHEKSRIVKLTFETNLNEKISSPRWPCDKDLTNDFCLERVTERESKCHLPWGLGIGADRKNWCTDALSLDTVLRIMPDERTMSKNDLIDHIKNYGCIVSCSYIAYKPIITYDKYFQEFYPDGDPKAFTYLNISPKNEDRRFMKEFYVYNWTTFFSDMGSYIGLLLGWSFLSVLEMVIDFLDILIRKKLTVHELTLEDKGGKRNAGINDQFELMSNNDASRGVSAVSSMISIDSEYIS